MNQEQIRQLLINYVNERGVKYSFVAEKIGVHRSTLCHYLKGDKSLAKVKLDRLLNFLVNN